jgi:hypothetical protein
VRLWAMSLCVCCGILVVGWMCDDDDNEMMMIKGMLAWKMKE